MKASVLLLLVLIAIGVTLPGAAWAGQTGAPIHRGAIVLGADEGAEGEGEAAEEPEAAEEGQEALEAQEGQEEGEEEGGATADGPQSKHRSQSEVRRHRAAKQSRHRANVGGRDRHKPNAHKHGKRKARTSTRSAKR